MDLGVLCPNLPREGVDLLRKMLALEPSLRISAEDAIKHEYFSELETSTFEGG